MSTTKLIKNANLIFFNQQECYKRQLDRLKEQESLLNAQIGELQSYLDAIAEDGEADQRATELVDYGAAMLTEPDLRRANNWFRRMMRVWVHPDRTLTIELL